MSYLGHAGAVEEIPDAARNPGGRGGDRQQLCGVKYRGEYGTPFSRQMGNVLSSGVSAL